MKMTVCGKGGCGKSTVTTLLSQEFARMGKKVLVVDSDESNFGLHRQLGMELPRDFTEFFGGKEKAMKKMLSGEIMTSMKLQAFAKKFFSEPFQMCEIPDEYLSEKDGVKLLSSGKIHKANEGCACPMNSILRQFLTHLTLADDEVAILDMEAGVEHFGRGTDNNVDAVLMVIDPSFESMRLAEKVAELCGSIHKPIYFFLNKVTPENEAAMEATVSKYGKVIGKMPLDAAIGQAGFTGEPLTGTYPQIQQVAKTLLGA